MAKITSTAQAKFLKSVYDPVNFNGWYWVGAQFNKTTERLMWTETGEKVKSFRSLGILTWNTGDDDLNCLCYSSNNHDKGYYFKRACHHEHLILCESLHPVETSEIPNREEALVEIGRFYGKSYFGDNVIRVAKAV
ncbi:unnamed protein product [Orchesella dallaii]|uniref:C-type lectin domain-containing protein n=1 Tax=Orchesella dallaii TaxID=48710 RepID=A0ABP1PKM7_9HEXA